jgi:hypothetical protein
VDRLTWHRKNGAVLFIASLTLGLTACTTFQSEDDELNTYIGSPVSEVARKLGPPTSKYQLGDGRSSFDWENYGGCNYSVIARSANPGSQSLADWKVESWQQTQECTSVR